MYLNKLGYLMNDLKSHTLKSVKWVIFANLFPKLITPVISVYLATILVPSAYGIVAISGTFIGFINIIQGFGIIDFIGKEKEINEDKLNTSFWLNVFLAITLFIILVLSSDFIAQMYSEPMLDDVLIVSGLVILIDSFGIVQIAKLRRDMQFKKLFWRSLIPVIVSIAITLPLAKLDFGVWSLVAGQVSRSFLNTVLFWYLTKWRPSVSFSKSISKDILKFGSWNNFEKFQEYFANNSLGILILGYFATSSQVGVYSVAIHILGTIFLILRAPIQNMTLPLLSKVQDSNELLLKTFKKIISRMMFINIPLTVGIFLLAEKGVDIIFPDKWANLGMVISIIVIGQGFLLSFGAQRELLKIINRPDIYPKTLTVNLITGAILFFISAKYFDLFWFCIARVINDVMFLILQIFIIHKYIKFEFSEIIKISFVPLLSSTIMGVSIYVVYFVLPEYNIFSFLLVIILGIIIYLSTYYLLDKIEFKKLSREILEILGIAKFSPKFLS